MAGVTLEEVLRLSSQLSPQEQAELVVRLQARVAQSTGQQLLAAIVARREAARAAGAFAHPHNLADRWARPDLDLSLERVQAGLREDATAWEQELERFSGRA